MYNNIRLAISDNYAYCSLQRFDNKNQVSFKKSNFIRNLSVLLIVFLPNVDLF